MRMNDYQKQAMKTRQFSDKKRGEQEEIVLLGLVGEVGDLLSCVKKKIRDGKGFSRFKERITEELGDTLWYLAAIADNYGVNLAEAAEGNIAKVARTFSPEKAGSLFYDEGFPDDEQLPRRLTLQFVASGDKVDLKRGEQRLGSPLTDNAYKDDGYRFHDAFHMAYAAMMGWSPILRKLVNAKRKKSKKVDEVEDGIRAGMTEEMVSLLVYMSSMTEGSDYRNPESIDLSVLRAIRSLVSELEVQSRTDVEWRYAISEGFKVFYALRENNGGFVSYDMQKRKIQYTKREPRNERARSRKRK